MRHITEDESMSQVAFLLIATVLAAIGVAKRGDNFTVDDAIGSAWRIIKASKGGDK